MVRCQGTEHSELNIFDLAMNQAAIGTMTDSLSQWGRSRQMAKVRSRDTVPERQVRSLLHSLGYRFTVKSEGIPGHPDIVFRGRRKVIFVHGCFWHRHPGCSNTRTPKTRVEFWVEKFDRNVLRDAEVAELLRASGWEAIVIWECETNRKDLIVSRLTSFLGEPRESR